MRAHHRVRKSSCLNCKIKTIISNRKMICYKIPCNIQNIECHFDI